MGKCRTLSLSLTVLHRPLMCLSHAELMHFKRQLHAQLLNKESRVFSAHRPRVHTNSEKSRTWDAKVESADAVMSKSRIYMLK